MLLCICVFLHLCNSTVYAMFMKTNLLLQTKTCSYLEKIKYLPTKGTRLIQTFKQAMETKEADFKAQGNAAYKAKNYELAIQHYTKAIDAAPKSDAAALCLCNRAICHGVLKNWPQSAADAKSCVEIKPDWVKGYQRLGIALRKQGNFFEAVQAVEKGLKINPDSADLKKTLVVVNV